MMKMRQTSPLRYRVLPVAALAAMLALGGCDGLTKEDTLPQDVIDPAIIETPEGALQVYRGVIVQFLQAFAGVVPGDLWDASAVSAGGALSDELRYAPTTASGTSDLIDQRALSGGTGDQVDLFVRVPYGRLNKVRGQANQAIGLIHDYRPADSALAGHAYALAGYAEIFLADLYCSGIPLSTLDYKGTYTVRPGSTTGEVFRHAVTLFDSALALGGDSAAVMDLARIGKGRALLSVGDYAAAAAAVSPVADGYTYVARYDLSSVNDRTNISNFIGATFPLFSVADREGSSGLDYLSSNDPRTAVVQDGGRSVPAKYPNGSSPIVVASGVEARLIEAEAALQQKDYPAWLAKLNYLRQTETFWAQLVPNPGAPLPLLEDPGPDGTGGDRLRVDLLFRERAFWLFLTGHRQGDLRRLIRQYGRLSTDVYPFGAYPLGGQYGDNVALPIPRKESEVNPLFSGCASLTSA